LAVRNGGTPVSAFDPLEWDPPPPYSLSSEQRSPVFTTQLRVGNRKKNALMVWRNCPDLLDAGETEIVLLHLLEQNAGVLEIIGAARAQLTNERGGPCANGAFLELGFRFKNAGGTRRERRRLDAPVLPARACADAVLAELYRRLRIEDEQIETYQSLPESSVPRGTRIGHCMVDWRCMGARLAEPQESRLDKMLKILQLIRAEAYEIPSLAQAAFADVWVAAAIDLAESVPGIAVARTTLARWQKEHANARVRARILRQHAPASS
jgi:hypothetical protein